MFLRLFPQEDFRQLVAFPAADFGLFNLLPGFAAVGVHPDLMRKEGEGPLEFGAELQMLAGIGPDDARHGAGIA